MKARMGAEISGRRRKEPEAKTGLVGVPTGVEARRPTKVPEAAVPAAAAPRKRRGSKVTRWWLGYAGIAIAATLVGLVSLDLAVGQWVVGLAGVGMLILKLDSHYSFGLALVTLGLVPLFLLLHRAGLADNYAVYSYFWMVFGVVAAVRELRG